MIRALFVVEAAIILLTSIKYLRIAQREHYIPKSVTRFALRWYKYNFSFLLLALVFFSGFVSVFYWQLSLVTVVILIFSPLKLTYKGKTSKLVYTRRLKTILATLVIIYIILDLISYLFIGLKYLGIYLLLSGVFLPLFLDVVLIINRPLEGLVSNKYERLARKKLSEIDPVVVGITGSYGKTTTKVLVGHLLQNSFEVLCSPKSFNNRNGLTRTVLEYLTQYTQILVAEMGTYGKGEIKEMVSWMKPQVAALIAVGPVHLERMKSLENILKAKSEIFETAEYAVINFDDPLIAAFSNELSKLGKRVCKCSKSASQINSCDVVVCSRSEDTFELFIKGNSVGTFDNKNLEVPLIDLSVAIGIVLYFDLSTEQIVRGLAALPQVEHRAIPMTNDRGVIIIDDTFNSNPSGASFALKKAVSYRSKDSNLYVVTPGMVEMGPMQHDANNDFAEEVLKAGGTLLVVKNTNKLALMVDNLRCIWFKDLKAVQSWLKQNSKPSDVVLFENDLPDHYP